jgi:NTE family protein
MVEDGLKLSFSGGGFRAMFYCLGGYRRLVELGLDSKVTHISSVSGGSITAGMILHALSNGPFSDVENFDKRVSFPLKSLGQINLRKKLIKKAFIPNFQNLKPELPRTRFSRLLPELLNEHVYYGKNMNQIPSSPEWSCNATCLNTMKRFRFKANDIYGNELGYSKDIENIDIALAVAASSAFPIMFAPIRFNVTNRKFINTYGTTDIKYKILYLTDGGVYDNLGSENLLKEDVPFIIMDASAETPLWKESYKPNYLNLNWRTFSVSLEQIVLLRRRLIYHFPNSNCVQLLIGRSVDTITQMEMKSRPPYRTFPNYTDCPIEIQQLIAGLRTDLDAFHDIEIDFLMWSGAIRMDLAIKSLMPNAISNEKWNSIPTFPPYDYYKIKEILLKGQKRSVVSVLHKSLH